MWSRKLIYRDYLWLSYWFFMHLDWAVPAGQVTRSLLTGLFVRGLRWSKWPLMLLHLLLGQSLVVRMVCTNLLPFDLCSSICMPEITSVMQVCVCLKKEKIGALVERLVVFLFCHLHLQIKNWIRLFCLQWDDHPAIMAVGVVDGTSEAIFQTLMSLGASRSE